MNRFKRFNSTSPNTKLISPIYTACLDPQCPFLFTSISLLLSHTDIRDVSPWIFTTISKSNKQVFSEPNLQRTEITKYVVNKSGIYCWINKLNGNFYIGSAIKLNNRINDNYQKSYLLEKKDLVIVKAINKYGLDNFNLVILEILPDLDAKILLKKEQYWISLLEPIYNVLTVAGNSSGFKHTEETKELLKLKTLGRKHTEEVRLLMSENRKGVNSTWYGKNLSEETKQKMSLAAKNRTKDSRPGFIVKVLDLENNQTTIYKSMREAAKGVGMAQSYFVDRLKKGIDSPYKNRFVITVER